MLDKKIILTNIRDVLCMYNLTLYRMFNLICQPQYLKNCQVKRKIKKAFLIGLLWDDF